MGKFDGILICSDWDGTLHSPNGLLDKDIKSIRYFQNNGGIFTICSGRPLYHLEEFFSDIKPNTYAVTLNGALIIDPDTKDILHKGYINKVAYECAEKLLKSVPGIRDVMIYIDDDIIRYPNTRDEFLTNISTYKRKNSYKLVLIAKSPEDTNLAKSLISQMELGEHSAVCSWATGLEIIHKNNAKDLATQRLKKATGSRVLVTVGDFENDIEMLKCGDISYAVGNASDYVKSFAKRVTCPVTEGAISAIISDIERDLVNLPRNKS